jgi:hypothetical protein
MNNTTGHLNTTHTVVIAEPPSRGLRFLVGLAMLYAFWANRRLIAGFLFSAVAPQAAAPEGFASVGTVTAVLVPMLIDFVVALGGGGIFAATMGWRVFGDLVAGAFQMIANWRNGQQIKARVSQAIKQATIAGTQAATGQAQDVATNEALTFRDPELAKFAALVQGTLADLTKRQAMADELLADVLQTRGGVTESSNPAAAPVSQ